jgi:hypothetical protein
LAVLLLAPALAVLPISLVPVVLFVLAPVAFLISPVPVVPVVSTEVAPLHAIAVAIMGIMTAMAGGATAIGDAMAPMAIRLVAVTIPASTATGATPTRALRSADKTE